MKAVIQRVSGAWVEIGGERVAEIGQGLLVLLGIGHDDGEEDIAWLCRKVSQLRIFNDDAGVMNRSVMEVGGDIIVVSQFTLHASTKKGNRPSYTQAAKPDVAVPLYEAFVEELGKVSGIAIQTGTFGADMQVRLTNDGPVTIIMDSKQKV